MKNTAILSLTSEDDGTAVGHLCILGRPKLTSIHPAEINAALHCHAIKKLQVMGTKNGFECSFPLTLANLFSVQSLAESAEQALFIAGLDGDYNLRVKSDLLCDV